MTKKVASAPAVATTFLIFAFCGVVKAEEPAGNENELVTVSFSLTVAAKLVLKPESAIAKLVTRIVISVEILRMLYSSLVSGSKKLNHKYWELDHFGYMCEFRQINVFSQPLGIW